MHELSSITIMTLELLGQAQPAPGASSPRIGRVHLDDRSVLTPAWTDSESRDPILPQKLTSFEPECIRSEPAIQGARAARVVEAARGASSPPMAGRVCDVHDTVPCLEAGPEYNATSLRPGRGP